MELIEITFKLQNPIKGPLLEFIIIIIIITVFFSSFMSDQVCEIIWFGNEQDHLSGSDFEWFRRTEIPCSYDTEHPQVLSNDR